MHQNSATLVGDEQVSDLPLQTPTEPGSASAYARAPRSDTSPNISPDASTTTAPDSIAIRAASAGLAAPSFFRLSSGRPRLLSQSDRLVTVR
jgi:hypothetical protein